MHNNAIRREHYLFDVHLHGLYTYTQLVYINFTAN